jgi:acyl carrier protein
MLELSSRPSCERVVALIEQILRQKFIKQRVAIDAELAQLGLASIDMVNLILAVEAEFDVMIPSADLIPENFQSILTIEALLEKLGA